MSMSKPKVGRASPRAAWIAVIAVLAVGFLVGSAAMAAVTPIKVVSYTPTYNQAGVAPDAPIQINFNGPVKDVSAQGNLVSGANPKISIDPQLGAGDQQIIFTATRSADKKSFLLTHSVPFKDATPYRIRIGGPILSDDPANFSDSADPCASDQPNPMLFTTLDPRSPFIVSHQPSDGATNVPVDAAVVINFNKPMDQTTVQVTRTPDVQLVGTWDATGMVLTLTHPANTAFQGGPTTYTFTVVGQDLGGKALIANPDGVNDGNRNPFSFTTHDTTPPTLASSTPANGAQGVAPDAPIVLNFNEKVKTGLNSFVTPGQGPAPTFRLFIGDVEQQNITWTVIPRDDNGTQSVTLLHDVKFQGGATYKFRLLKNGSTTDASQSPNALQDVAGNKIGSVIEFTFTIRDTTPPTVVSSMPPDNWGYPGGNPNNKDPFDALTVPNGSRWTPTGEITITFSKPINPATFAIDFRKEGSSDQVGGIQFVWSQNNTVVVIRHDKLEANDISDYQLTITSAKDLSGNDLVPGAISDNVLNFRTQDLQAPGVASTDPTHGALLGPTGTRKVPSSGSAPADQIVVTFTEKVFNKGNLDGAWTTPPPVIRLAYADGATPPLVTNATPVGTGTGIYTLDQDSAWNSTGTAVTLTVAPYDNNTGFRYIPGDQLIATITSATDKYGNGGTNVRSVAPNPWVVDIEDTRPATIKGVTIGSTAISADQAINGPAPFTAQDSTIAIRFSKAMNSVTYTDTHAAGQPADAWSSGSPVTLTVTANPNNFSGDHRIVFLKLSQAGLPNADITHTINITAATDSNNVAMDPASQFKTFSFKTGPKPYIVKVEYQAPTAFQPDNSGDGLRRDGTLGRNDEFDGQKWQWATIAQADAQHVLQPVLTATNPVVPLNSKIRVTFSQSMDPTSVPLVTSQPASTGWSVAWSNSGAIANAVATFSHSTLFTDSNVPFGTNGMPKAPRYVMQVGSGADFKGDALESTPSFSFTTVDVSAPTFTVEYQTNTKDDGTWDGDPVWAPLTNGTSNVPIKTRFRITANETIGPWGSPLDPNAAPLVTIARHQDSQSDITAANPQISTRQTPTDGPSSGIVGSRVIVTLSNAMAGGYLDSNGYEQRSSYRVLFTVKDTRILGDPNATTQDITFTTVDRFAPQIHDIKPSSSDASSPDTPIVVTFTEPVNPDTVSIANEGSDSGDVTFTTKEVSNGGKTITFRHTPFSQPTSGSPFTFKFHVNGGYKDLAGNTQGSQSATFTVTVPAETVPPTVVSMVSTRDTVVMEFSEAVISATTTGNDATFDVRSSAANPANYLAPLAPTGATGLGSSSAALSNNADVSSTNARNAVAGKVSYVFYDSTPVIGPNNTTVPYGWRIVNKNIASVQYNGDTRTATLILDSPLTEGQGSGQPEFVVVQARGGLPNYPAGSDVEPRIRDLSTNSLVNGRRQTSPQEGRLDWQINLGVTTNVPGASIDTHNVIGVRAGAVDGFGGGDEDIPKVLPPLQNFVYLASQHSDSEPGWAGAGGVYAQDLMSRPGLNDVRSWPKIGITTDLGAQAAPATITLTWNLAAPGHEVPYFDAVELLDPSDINGDGIKSYDMRKVSSFSFQVATDGILTTQFLGIKVYTPSTVSHQFATGFNLMSVPVAPINPAPSSVFFGLSPLFAYRYDSTAQQYDIYPMVPSFDSIEAGRGYWIQPKAPTTISVLGSRVVGTQSIKLKAGWNLIGSPFGAPVSGSTLLVKSSGTVMSVAQAVKAGIVDGNLLSYDNAQRSYVPSDLATGVMNPWVGYWLLANQDAELLISNPG